MTTNQILQLDCRKEENKEIIQRVLRQIKPLSKYSEEHRVPFSAVEKAVNVMSKKYNVRIAHIHSDVLANDDNTIWRATICNDKTLGTISVVYGLSIYELLAKCAILMYAQVKKGIGVRNEV